MSGIQLPTDAERDVAASARAIQIGLVYCPRLPSMPSKPIAVNQTRHGGPLRIASALTASASVNPPR